MAITYLKAKAKVSNPLKPKNILDKNLEFRDENLGTYTEFIIKST